jgi:hopanoid C-3 methylase
MKILFIRPLPPAETIGLQHVMIVEPLELEILATLVEEGNEINIVDLILENKPFDFFLKTYNPDVVCITGYITHTLEMMKICEKAKTFNNKIITVVGGVHIEKMPESINHQALDFRVVRNATIAFPKLIKYLQNTCIFPEGVLKFGEFLDESRLPAYNFSVPIPNRSLTKQYRSKYFYVFHNKVALLKASFGCPYQCNFCYCRKITSDIYFERPLEDVITELKSIKEKEVYIIDDNFLVSKTRLQKFLELLKFSNISKKYLIYGRADFIASNPDLIREFKALGLRTIIVGFESFENNELDAINKNTSAMTNYAAMEVLNRIGVDCYASIIAMPNWDEHDFKKATQIMIDLKIRFLNIQPLTPLGKTDFTIDESKLVIARNEYPKWDLAHVVIQPEKLTIKEYYKSILKMYEKVLFQPGNLFHHLKYPPLMQLKLLLGALKVRKQYLNKIANL